MKKIILLFSLCSLFFSLGYAYNQTDVDNATYLANESIVSKKRTNKEYHLDNQITRAEVIGIALKLRRIKIPEKYTCKKYFSDTTKNDWVCRAVELAADQGFISRENKEARPQDSITRAEALAILVSDNSDNGMVIYSLSEGSEWQKKIFYKYAEATYMWKNYFHKKLPIVDGTNIDVTYEPHTMPEVVWQPDNTATRAEVFAFARNIREDGMGVATSEATK